MSLAWLRLPGKAGAYFIYTEQGYKVSKVFSNGVPGYLAWPPKPEYNRNARDWRENLLSSLGCFDNPEQAKECCEQHHKDRGHGR